MWEISNVGTGASVEMVDAQEVSEGNELNKSGEYTKWPLWLVSPLMPPNSSGGENLPLS